jgi:hypothetical protein
MFVRFRPSGHRLHVSLVEARRHDGKVRNDHIAGLGSIINAPTIADRVVFWQRANERLEALGNRIGPEIEKVEAALHERVPIPSLEEQRALKLENARAEARIFDTMADLHGALAANHKAVATAANAKRFGNEAASAASAVRAVEARERIAKIEAGEDVRGGLGRPLSNADMIAILKAAGLTNAEIRYIGLQRDLIEVIGARLGEPEVEKVFHALTEIAVKVAIEAPDRAVRKFTRELARPCLQTMRTRPGERLRDSAFPVVRHAPDLAELRALESETGDQV